MTFLSISDLHPFGKDLEAAHDHHVLGPVDNPPVSRAAKITSRVTSPTVLESFNWYRISSAIITPASKHVKGCHAGLDPASSPVLDSRFLQLFSVEQL